MRWLCYYKQVEKPQVVKRIKENSLLLLLLGDFNERHDRSTDEVMGLFLVDFKGI